MSEAWRHLLQLDSGNPPPFLCQQTLAQIRTGISLQVATPVAQERRPPAVKLFAFLLTVVKLQRRRVMQLAGYFCPTTEEVAVSHKIPPPPKNIPPSLSPATSNETREESRWRVDPSRSRCLSTVVPFIFKVFR